MSKLLIDDYPIQVLPKLAVQIGLNEAIILQQMHYWLSKSTHYHENKKWIYNSYPKWQEQFPFWSEMTIRRTIGSLEKQNLLHVGNYNKVGFDKTKWYSINYEELERVNRPSVQNEQTMRSKRTGGSVQDEQTNTRDYTEITTENNNSSSNDEHDVRILKEFNEWWELYNKKVGKKAALTKFKTARKKHSYEEITEGTKKYLIFVKDKDKQFWQHPKTFLFNETYLEDYSNEISDKSDNFNLWEV